MNKIQNFIAYPIRLVIAIYKHPDRFNLILKSLGAGIKSSALLLVLAIAFLFRSIEWGFLRTDFRGTEIPLWLIAQHQEVFYDMIIFLFLTLFLSTLNELSNALLL